MKKTIIIAVAAALAAGGLSFFGGMQYASAHGRTGAAAGGRGGFANTTADQMQQRFGGAGGARTGARGFGGMTMGEILDKGDGTLTVKMPDGGSRIVFFSDSTTITKSAAGTADDLTTGATVRVSGSANSDGSVTAQDIQIMPAGSDATFFQRTGGAPQGGQQQDGGTAPQGQ